MDSQLSKILSINNPFTQEQVREGFVKWPTNLNTCLQRAASFSSLRERVQKIGANKSLQTLQTLQQYVKQLEPLLRPPTNIEKEGYEQIFFQGSPWSEINFIPFTLIFLSFYKSFIVPSFSVCLPLISIILPYIFLNTFYNVRMPFKEYMTLIWRMWNGTLQMPKNPEDFLNARNAIPVEQPPAALQIKSLLQNAWTIFTIGQAVWHPVQQARHFIKLDKDCLKLGECVIGVKGCMVELWNRWKGWMPSWLESWIPLCPDDPRQAFAFVMESPFWLRHAFRALGRFEILLHLAIRDDIVPVQFVRSDTPVLMIKDFGDPSIPIEKRVVSSVKLGGGKAHAIVTGPNRGGKSSFLRGVLMNVVIAHSFGAVFAGAGQMTHFTWIADGMRLDDTPGEQSMFEREVAFGSAILKKKGGLGLVLYDELFHSTNPPDAKRTSELFCNRLWKKKNCLTLVSTHVYSLAREAPAAIQRLCMGTWRHGDKYTFSYTVQKGICEVSSVDLLLKQFHLLR